MKKYLGNSMHTFLLEVTLVLLVFSLVSVSILKGFLKAETMGEQSSNRIQGSIIANQCIEEMRSLEIVPNLPIKWYYDEKWELASVDEAKFVVCIRGEEEKFESGSLYRMVLEVTSAKKINEEQLVALPFNHYIPR